MLLRTLSAYGDTLKAAHSLLDPVAASSAAERQSLQRRIRRTEERYAQIYDRQVPVTKTTPLFEPEEEEAERAPETPAPAATASELAPETPAPAASSAAQVSSPERSVSTTQKGWQRESPREPTCSSRV